MTVNDHQRVRDEIAGLLGWSQIPATNSPTA